MRPEHKAYLTAVFTSTLAPYIGGLTEDNIRVTEEHFHPGHRDLEHARRVAKEQGLNIALGVDTAITFDIKIDPKIAKTIEECVSEVANIYSKYKVVTLRVRHTAEKLTDNLKGQNFEAALKRRLG